MLKQKRLILVAAALLGAAGCVYGVVTRCETVFLFSLFAALFVALFYFFALFMHSAWKKDLFQKADQTPLVSMTKRQKLYLCAFVALLILVCTLPMGLSPYWNGVKPQHRLQYELTAEAFLNGQLHMDYYVDPLLLELENPYSLEARKESGAFYMWDHAFYNEKYYMYFGVVPVFLTFLPYRIITGTSLTTYHATQLYAALTIIGIFVLFGLLTRLFFRYLSAARYAAMGASFSAISLWYSVSAPALYCTAVTSAICLMVWSLYFFMRAVFVAPSQNRQILCAFSGSLLGALAFGCRPPIALANMLVLPLLIFYLRRNKLTLRLLLKLILAALPYLAVALALMAYNAVRFDNPFEFGQSYQLTVTDQSQYMNSISSLDPVHALKTVAAYFFAPLIPPEFGGVFMNFPVLLLVFGLFFPGIQSALKRRGLLPFACWLFITPIVITLMDILWSPYLLERYRMDIYFIMGILCFLVICSYGSLETKRQRVFDVFTYGFSFLSVFTSMILFLIPYDCNFTAYVMERLFPFF